ncbi:MAG: CDGSH iron-sulfur domain-containing protein, partial [Anaerolineaceae bacterium]|nr:CDGSH iron-sulfur domain-containing protein [Anaerolineaceae bacterium]
QHETYEKNGHIRTHVKMTRGEAISLCRCWKSTKFPLCDGSHNALDSDLGPAVITVDCDHNFRDGK